MLFPKPMFFIKAVSVILMLASFAYGFFVIGPSTETRFYPVMGKIEILKWESPDPDITIIHPTFYKFRNCEYIGLAWYRGQRDAPAMRAVFDILRQADDASIINRPIGQQVANPWRIGVPITELEINSFADAFHRCHPFWLTKSQIYN